VAVSMGAWGRESVERRSKIQDASRGGLWVGGWGPVGRCELWRE